MPYITIDKTLREVIGITDYKPTFVESNLLAVEVTSLENIVIRHNELKTPPLDSVSYEIEYITIPGTSFSQSEIDAEIAKQAVKSLAETTAKDGYAILPDYLKTMTANDATVYINGQIFSGMSQAQVNSWIDANITGTTVTQLRSQMITALKQIAGALIAMREIFLLTSKLLIYVRDLVIRFK